MTGFLRFLLLWIALAWLLGEVDPAMAESSRAWAALAMSAAVATLMAVRRRLAAKEPAPPRVRPDSLEALERRRAAQPVVQWPKADPAPAAAKPDADQPGRV